MTSYVMARQMSVLSHHLRYIRKSNNERQGQEGENETCAIRLVMFDR